MKKYKLKGGNGKLPTEKYTKKKYDETFLKGMNDQPINKNIIDSYNVDIIDNIISYIWFNQKKLDITMQYINFTVNELDLVIKSIIECIHKIPDNVIVISPGDSPSKITLLINLLFLDKIGDIFDEYNYEYEKIKYKKNIKIIMFPLSGLSRENITFNDKLDIYINNIFNKYNGKQFIFFDYIVGGHTYKHIINSLIRLKIINYNNDENIPNQYKGVLLIDPVKILYTNVNNLAFKNSFIHDGTRCVSSYRIEKENTYTPKLYFEDILFCNMFILFFYLYYKNEYFKNKIVNIKSDKDIIYNIILNKYMNKTCKILKYDNINNNIVIHFGHFLDTYDFIDPFDKTTFDCINIIEINEINLVKNNYKYEYIFSGYKSDKINDIIKKADNNIIDETITELDNNDIDYILEYNFNRFYTIIDNDIYLKMIEDINKFNPDTNYNYSGYDSLKITLLKIVNYNTTISNYENNYFDIITSILENIGIDNIYENSYDYVFNDYIMLALFLYLVKNNKIEKNKIDNMKNLSDDKVKKVSENIKGIITYCKIKIINMKINNIEELYCYNLKIENKNISFKKMSNVYDFNRLSKININNIISIDILNKNEN